MATKQAASGDPEVGARIREIRNWRRLTLKELAARAKIDQTNLSKLETAQIGFSAESIRRIASALDVPVSYLFSTTPVPTVYWVPFRNQPDRPMQAVSRRVTESAFAWEVQEDALGTIIQPGDIVICEPGLVIRRGKFVVAKYKDQTIVRRVTVKVAPKFSPTENKDGVMLINIEEDAVFELLAEDSMFPPLEAIAGSQCEVLGPITLRITNMLNIPQ